MKPYILLFTFLVLASCSGTKKVAEQKSQQEANQPINNTVVTPNTTKEDTTQLKDSLISKVAKITPEAPKTITTVKDSVAKAPSVVKDKLETVPVPKAPTTPEKPEVKTANHDAFNNLLQRYVSPKGNVNYIGIKQNRKALLNYINHLADNVPQDTWSKNEKLAYWINAYNALTIDLILRHWPVKSIKDIDKPWDQRFWKLGDKWYNLNEIEHDILRKMDDPRIHFAIVCASFSCPKLQNKAFKANTMNAQLTDATKSFLSDPARNTISANNLELSKIFQWFAKDFKQDGDLISFLNTYSAVKINSNAKKRFKDYNWDLNE